MFGNGPGHSGFYPKTIGSGTFSQAWSKSFSTAINQVVIRADTIYGTTNGYFSNPMSAFALNAADGSLKWTYPLPEAYSVNPPAYSDGRLYFQRGNSSGDTHLWCLDAASGRFLWAAPHSAQWERYLAPTIADGGVFVNGGMYGGMYGFDALTGTQRFFATLGQEDGWTPAYADGVVYTCVNGNFIAHNPNTGSQLWARNLTISSTGTGNSNSWYDGNVPVISNGKATVIGGNRIVVVDINSRTQLWSLPGNYVGVPAMAGDVVYACLGNEVKAYDAATGALLGTYAGSSALSGQPLVTNDLVIASGTSATFIFNRSTFALQQTLPAGGTLSYASGLLCVSKGEIFGTSSGTLVAYRVQTTEEDPAPSPLPPVGPPEPRANPSRPLGNAAGLWIDCVRSGGIIYFLFESPAKLERFEIATGTWLTPISLPTGPKAVAVSSSGIYVSFGKSISTFSLDGAWETPLLNMAYETRFLFERNGMLFLSDSTGANWASVDVSTGRPISTKKYSFYSLKGVSVSPTSPNIYAVSGSEISRTTINADGTFGTQTTSRYYGDYPSGTRGFLFPGEGRLATDAGIVYSASDLTYLGSLAGAFTDLDFTADGAPIVLRQNSLVAYSTGLLETGRKALNESALRIFIEGDQVYSFSQLSGRGVGATATSISSIAPNQPGPAIDPTNIDYTPDAIEYDGNGTVYLLSKLHQSVFRWSVGERRYLPTIALTEVPIKMAHSKTLNRLYLSYASGRISYLDLAGTAPGEVNFVNSPQSPLGLAVLDDFLFACDGSGSWVTFYVYDSTGKLVSSKELGKLSTEYIWSPATRKLYYLWNGVSPNDLNWRDVDLEGVLGTEKDSPYHGDYVVQYPIRVSPDGATVVLGNGHLYAGISLERKGALANGITDAVWQGGNLFTVRSITPLGGTAATAGELQAWNGSFQLSASGTSTGIPLRLFPLADSLLVISKVNGKIRFARHGLDLAQISSDPGDNQPPSSGLQPRPNPSRPLPDTSAQWIDSVQANGIAYFLFNTPAKIERYDLINDRWLTPISLPDGPGVLTATENGIFVSFGKSVSIFSLDGATETPLFTASAEVFWLYETGGKLYVEIRTGEFGLVNTATGALVASSGTGYYNTLRGLSFSAQKKKFFGRDSGLSPADIHYLALNADGSFGTVRDSPYHGAYPSASRTYVFPNGELVADNSGIIYSATDLAYAGSLAGPFDDLAFSGDAPVLLRGNTLAVYNTSLAETGRAMLSGAPLRLFVSGQNAFTFEVQNGRGVAVQKTPLSTIPGPTPAPVVNPTNLTYSPDQVIKGPEDTIFLLSKQHRNVFRWSVSNRAYLTSIPLIDQPLTIAYSEANSRLYIGYSGGRITWIDLNAANPIELPFVNLAQSVDGMVAADEFLLAVDGSALTTHYTFSASAQLLSSRSGSERSADYVWNAFQRKIYYFRDNVIPNDLLTESINLEGKLGNASETPYHGTYAMIHPIRVAVDGSVVLLGSGDLYNGTTLNRIGSLPGSTPNGRHHIDAAWMQGQLLTVRDVNAGNGEIQAWSNVQAGGSGSYSMADTASVQGSPLKMFSISDRIVVVSDLNGRPHFSVYNTALDRLSIDPAPGSTDPDPDAIEWSRIKGIYTATFAPETDRKLNNSGLLQITLAGRGRFTGVVRIGAQIIPISGSFASDGSADVSFKLAGLSYTLKLHLEMNEEQPVLSGMLETRTWSAELAGSRGWKQRNGRSPQAGRYTVILNDPSEYLRDTVPPIPAVGTLKVSKYGSAQLVLLFANGERASFGGQVNEDGTYQIFVMTHGEKGHVQGMVSLDPSMEGNPSGTLHWIKPLQLKAAYYPLDIDTDLEFSASRYQWRTPMLDVAFSWPQANCVAAYLAGDLHETTGQAAYLNRKNRLLFGRDDKNTVLRFAPETGLVSGSFIHPRTGLKSPITAVLFQARNSAFGYFQGLRSCGVFYFGPPATTGGNAAGVEGTTTQAGVTINSFAPGEN